MLDTLFNKRSACTKIQSEALIERLRNVTARCSIRSSIRGRHALRQSEALTDKRKPTSMAKLRIDLVYLSSDPGYSNALPLRLRAACASHALYPADEFDAPSVRNNTKPRNIRVQPPQGVPTLHLANIEPACLDTCVCVRAWFRSGECPKTAVGHGSQEFVSQHTVNTTFIGHHTRSMEWSYTIIQRMIHGTKGSAGWAPAWSMLAVGSIHSVTEGTNAKKSVYSAFCSRQRT
jgi:hypothetical protein